MTSEVREHLAVKVPLSKAKKEVRSEPHEHLGAKN